MSNSSITLTMLTLIVFVALPALVYKTGSEISFILCCLAICLALLLSLFYVPMAIEVTDEQLIIHRALKKKRIALNNISGAEPMAVAPDTRRVCGSGGFMGHWGWFSSPTIGSYFAYYGQSTNCILIKLKSDRKYLLGCFDYEEICHLINTRR